MMLGAPRPRGHGAPGSNTSNLQGKNKEQAKQAKTTTHNKGSNKHMRKRLLALMSGAPRPRGRGAPGNNIKNPEKIKKQDKPARQNSTKKATNT